MERRQTVIQARLSDLPPQCHVFVTGRRLADAIAPGSVHRTAEKHEVRMVQAVGYVDA
jgi:hypothetical protein